MQHGDLPARERNVRDRPAPTDLMAPQHADLRPLHMEPPSTEDGLRPVGFTTGLDEIDIGTLRTGGQRAKGEWRGVANESALDAARRRASEIARGL